METQADLVSQRQCTQLLDWWLVAAKVRLAKQRLTIPRLELVAGDMAVNSVDNIRHVLDGFPVTSVLSWLDSSVALQWICGNGE